MPGLTAIGIDGICCGRTILLGSFGGIIIGAACGADGLCITISSGGPNIIRPPIRLQPHLNLLTEPSATRRANVRFSSSISMSDIFVPSIPESCFSISNLFGFSSSIIITELSSPYGSSVFTEIVPVS